MKKKVIYISGKVTGTSDYADRFSAVEEKPTWVQYMKYAIAAMMQADYIYMMSGWNQSKGARLEHFLARVLNYNIIYEE